MFKVRNIIIVNWPNDMSPYPKYNHSTCCPPSSVIICLLSVGEAAHTARRTHRQVQSKYRKFTRACFELELLLSTASMILNTGEQDNLYRIRR